MLECKIYKNFDQDVQDLWCNLNNKYLNTSFEWLNTWWEVFKNKNDNLFGHEKELFIIVLYKNGCATAMLPLVKYYKVKYRVKIYFLSFLGEQWGATYIDVIGQDIKNTEIEYMFKFIKKHIKYDLILFSHVHQKSILLQSKMLEHNYLLSGCPQVYLGDIYNYEDYRTKYYSKSLRQNIRTAFNHIKKENHVYDFSIEAFSTENFKSIADISVSKLKSGKHSIYLDKDKKEFIRQLGNRIKNDIIFITIDGIKKAYRLNFYFKDSKYCLDASYDREYYKYQVGILSVDESIKDSFNKKVIMHCEGTGIDEYKLKFIKDFCEIYTLLGCGNSLIGKLIIWKYKFAMRKKEQNFISKVNEMSKYLNGK
ncbi:GNAT family N-acetyltransferase [Anaerosinus sp.]